MHRMPLPKTSSRLAATRAAPHANPSAVGQQVDVAVVGSRAGGATGSFPSNALTYVVGP